MVVAGTTAWTASNPVFAAYVFYSGLLIAKVLLMGPLTGFKRITRRVFANPEDRISKTDKIKFDDPEVERVRRAHQNDVENILPFLTAGLLYVATDPSPTLALNLFRFVFVSRVMHTLVYAFNAVPQPARAIAYFGPWIATFYMALTSVLFFSNK